MTPVEEQFEALRGEYPGAELEPHPDGSLTVTVPDVPLPEGWEPRTTTVRFLVPVGYPAGRPDCFWTDDQVKLIGGKVPQATGQNPKPYGPHGLLWFSWHIQNWSPNFDTLLTYFNVVTKRFETKQ